MKLCPACQKIFGDDKSRCPFDGSALLDKPGIMSEDDRRALEADFMRWLSQEQPPQKQPELVIEASARRADESSQIPIILQAAETPETDDHADAAGIAAEVILTERQAQPAGPASVAAGDPELSFAEVEGDLQASLERQLAAARDADADDGSSAAKTAPQRAAPVTREPAAMAQSYPRADDDERRSVRGEAIDEAVFRGPARWAWRIAALLVVGGGVAVWALYLRGGDSRPRPEPASSSAAPRSAPRRPPVAATAPHSTDGPASDAGGAAASQPVAAATTRPSADSGAAAAAADIALRATRPKRPAPRPKEPRPKAGDEQTAEQNKFRLERTIDPFK